MASASINELIQMYSSGVISREGLERGVRYWDHDGYDTDEGSVHSENFVTLSPDIHGVWRVED